MDSVKIWINGILILLLFVTLGEMIVAFHEYVYRRFGINRNIILAILWVLPAVASFYVAYHVKSNKILFGISYIILLPLLGVVAHYFNGKVGGSVDFISSSGLIVVAKIYFVLSLMLCGIGTFLGIKFSS